jgi:hypothetical protein
MLNEQLKVLGIAPPDNEEARVLAFWANQNAC